MESELINNLRYLHSVPTVVQRNIPPGEVEGLFQSLHAQSFSEGLHEVFNGNS
jgi:hypothetical protein